MKDHTTDLVAAEGAVAPVEPEQALLDPMPEGEIEDIDAWCAEYRARLARTVIPHRNRVRDARVLEVICGLMREQQSRSVLAPLRPLSERSNFDKKTILSALDSLRANGYLLRVARDSESHGWRYCLVMEKLEALSEGEEPAPPPASNFSAIRHGDYRDDAFHSKALNKSQVAVYTYLRANGGLTAYAIAKATRLDYKTVKSAVEKLVEERMARVDGKCIWARTDVVRTDSNLSDIAVKHHTVGKTRERMDTYDTDRVALAYLRRNRIKMKDHQEPTPTEELEFDLVG